jgi:hypothetical protein
MSAININMSEKRTVTTKLTQIEKYCKTYILSAIREADWNKMVRFNTRIENQIIKIYTDHPGYKDAIRTELLRIQRNETFGLYFDMFDDNDVEIIIASNRFREMAIKYHDQQNLPVIASASCNSTRTVGGKRKNKSKRKNRNKSKTRRRSRK